LSTTKRRASSDVIAVFPPNRRHAPAHVEGWLRHGVEVASPGACLGRGCPTLFRDSSRCSTISFLLNACEVVIQSSIELPCNRQRFTDKETQINASPLKVEEFAVEIEVFHRCFGCMDYAVPFLVERIEPVRIVGIRLIADRVLRARLAMSMYGFDALGNGLFDKAVSILTYLISYHPICTYRMKVVQSHPFALYFMKPI
jgi:hypothetical protein